MTRSDPRKDESAALAGDLPSLESDALQRRRRALWHDVRSILGAVMANVEFVAGQELPKASRTALLEVEHEVRLVADVVEIVSARRDPDATLELDLRALLWVARQSGVAIAVDATVTPFLVRGAFKAIEELVAAIGDAATSARGSPQPAFSSDGSQCRITRLDVSRAKAIASGSAVSALDVSATVEDGTLVLSRTRR